MVSIEEIPHGDASGSLPPAAVPPTASADDDVVNSSSPPTAIDAGVAGVVDEPVPASEERILDAIEIESLLNQVQRPTVRMQLESLAKKLRKDAAALLRVEKSHGMAMAMTSINDEKKEETSPTSTSTVTTPEKSMPVVSIVTPPPKPVGTTIVSSSVKYIPIDRFSFDAGGYNAPFVTVYVSLPGVGSIEPNKVQSKFTSSSFDVVVEELNGKSYRLFKDNLEKDIVADKCKIIVKSDKIIVKLAKVKGEYGSFDYWTKLVDNKKRRGANGTREKEDPQKSIMQLMKDMYDEGDDNIKKTIGEAMLKQQRGELDRDPMKGGGFNNFDDDF